ncbi:MAG: hypothetical protein ACXWQO_11990 [Bdellovibrionota bacterium]
MKIIGIVALAIFATQFVPAAHAAWMKPILVCDNGAATVSVDLGERRNVNLVVNNQRIAEYFANNGGLSSSMRIENGQIVVGAGLNSGIFDSSQFRGFESAAANAPAVQVYREGSSLRLRLVSLAHKECIDYRPNDYYCAETRDVPEQERANWLFRSCEEKSANP